MISQSVKEIVQSLVDDDLVDTEKIGTSVYFWAFPSKAAATGKRKIQDLEEQLQQAKRRRAAIQESLSLAQRDRQPTEQRQEVWKDQFFASCKVKKDLFCARICASCPS